MLLFFVGGEGHVCLILLLGGSSFFRGIMEFSHIFGLDHFGRLKVQELADPLRKRENAVPPTFLCLLFLVGGKFGA